VKSPNQQRLEQWYHNNTSPEFLEGMKAQHDLDFSFEWVHKRIVKAGLECVLIPGTRCFDMVFHTERLSPTSSLLRYTFSFVMNVINDPTAPGLRIYEEVLPGRYAIDPHTYKLTKV
jgi:hypothetical protein